MATKRLSAQISDEAIAIAAYKLGMSDCPPSEVGKAIVLIGAGLSPEKAREKVLELRNPVKLTDQKNVLGVYVPEQWLKDAMEHEGTPQDLSPSERFRYWCHRLTKDPAEALECAKVPQGRPRKIIGLTPLDRSPLGKGN